jgi:hypothetical protein
MLFYRTFENDVSSWPRERQGIQSPRHGSTYLAEFPCGFEEIADSFERAILKKL